APWARPESFCIGGGTLPPPPVLHPNHSTARYGRSLLARGISVPFAAGSMSESGQTRAECFIRGCPAVPAILKRSALRHVLLLRSLRAPSYAKLRHAGRPLVGPLVREQSS